MSHEVRPVSAALMSALTTLMEPAETPKKPPAVGSTIWEFDSNHRVYLEPNSGPDYRSHWQPVTITGETARSWIIGKRKVPKGGGRHFAFTQDEVDRDCWAHEHRWKIVRLVEQCDPAILRRVAQAVGYEK